MKRNINEAKRMQKLAGILKEEYAIGDSIEINASSFPNYEFPYGTTGEIVDIDSSDYASDELTYTVKLKYVDPTGEEFDTLFVDDNDQIL
jgi:hypothetical protein